MEVCTALVCADQLQLLCLFLIRTTFHFLQEEFYTILGRVVTYSFLGAVLGLIGSKIALAGAQQVVSIILGVVVIVAVLLPQKYKNYFAQHPVIQKLAHPLKSNIGVLFKKGTFSAMFLIGILNGFLPCGLVYVALAGAIASGDAISGAAVMILFGLGTVPAMFAASVFGKFINIGIRTKIRKAVPVLAIHSWSHFYFEGNELGNTNAQSKSFCSY